MNLYSRFLNSRFFPFIAGGVVLLMISILVWSYWPKSKEDPDKKGRGFGGFLNLTNYFNSQGRQAIDLQEAVKEQKKVGEEVALFEDRVVRRYAWRKKLPLTSQQYFVYFDFVKKGFVGRLYPDNDDLIEQIKAEAIRRLKKELEIPLEEFVTDWDVYPRSNFQ